MARQYLSADELPPRPDSSTGLPRPPRAPWSSGEDGHLNQSATRQSTTPAPDPPPGQGPVLAWYRQGRRGAVAGAVMVGAVVAGLGVLTRGLDSIELWPAWVIIVLTILLVYYIARKKNFSAGADWVAHDDKWVRLYELTEATGQATGSGVFLRLRDSGGRYLELKFITVISSDRLVWDLTYNGILHSVIAGGAKTNSLLHRTIKLPYPKPDRAGDRESSPSED
jgi:hypothetical protein